MDILCCIAALGINLLSTHVDAPATADYNNHNLGAYVEFTNGVTFGTYYNSERTQSYILGYTHNFNIGSDKWVPLVQVGVVTGYARASVLPGATLGLRRHIAGNTWARLIWLPKVSDNGAHVFHLSAEYRF